MKKKLMIICVMLIVGQQSFAMQSLRERLGNAWQQTPSMSSFTSRLSLPSASTVGGYGAAALAPFAMQQAQIGQQYSPYAYFAPWIAALAIGAYLNRQEGASGALRATALSLPALLGGAGAYYLHKPQNVPVAQELDANQFVGLGQQQQWIGSEKKAGPLKRPLIGLRYNEVPRQVDEAGLAPGQIEQDKPEVGALPQMQQVQGQALPLEKQAQEPLQVQQAQLSNEQQEELNRLKKEYGDLSWEISSEIAKMVMVSSYEQSLVLAYNKMEALYGSIVSLQGNADSITNPWEYVFSALLSRMIINTYPDYVEKKTGANFVSLSRWCPELVSNKDFDTFVRALLNKSGLVHIWDNNKARILSAAREQNQEWLAIVTKVNGWFDVANKTQYLLKDIHFIIQDVESMYESLYRAIVGQQTLNIEIAIAPYASFAEAYKKLHNYLQRALKHIPNFKEENRELFNRAQTWLIAQPAFYAYAMLIRYFQQEARFYADLTDETKAKINSLLRDRKSVFANDVKGIINLPWNIEEQKHINEVFSRLGKGILK